MRKCIHPVLICAFGPPHCIVAFRDELSVREWGISGLCQECQDRVSPTYVPKQEGNDEQTGTNHQDAGSDYR